MQDKKALFVADLKSLLQQKLSRGDRVVSNSIVNGVIVTYRNERMIVKASVILEDLANIKNAKSQEELYYNIANNIQAGTRQERVEVDFSTLNIDF